MFVILQGEDFVLSPATPLLRQAVVLGDRRTFSVYDLTQKSTFGATSSLNLLIRWKSSDGESENQPETTGKTLKTVCVQLCFLVKMSSHMRLPKHLDLFLTPLPLPRSANAAPLAARGALRGGLQAAVWRDPHADVQQPPLPVVSCTAAGLGALVPSSLRPHPQRHKQGEDEQAQ